MPSARNPVVFEQAFHAASALLAGNDFPTRQIGLHRDQLFRYVDRKFLPKPASGAFASTAQQNAAISPFDEYNDSNRWSGKSPVISIPGKGGLYAVIHPHALINELRHGNAKWNPAWNEKKLDQFVIVELRIARAQLMLDLSPANPGAARFWKLFWTKSKLNEHIHQPRLKSEDCSIQRAIGLAVAHCQFLQGLIVQTIRTSDRSAGEVGENIIFFGPNAKPIPHLVVEKITYIDS
jgi:hypothetical protein